MRGEEEEEKLQKIKKMHEGVIHEEQRRKRLVRTKIRRSTRNGGVEVTREGEKLDNGVKGCPVLREEFVLRGESF